ncbi:spermidine synthase-like [Artemia franciscana]|uniref:spermidine synthase-like n=1 Tax=Artemia franciscana TaxID=6661 RepID=UPI0032DB162D
MDAMKEGWFSEFSSLWDGQSLSLEVKQVIHKEKSRYQDILVLDTQAFGRVLVLDGVIQCTEKDEFSYQEMISFLPLNCHPKPKKVLIVGGGDGGVAREVAKHPSVESIHQCEIDGRVIEVSKKYLPFMAKGFESPKFHLHVGDGFEFIKKHSGEFDVIITDSSDPVGPAESLFGDEYYMLISKALRHGGIVCSQGENPWFHADIIDKLISGCKKIFPVVDYAYTCIPTYPGGQIGFLLCSNSPDTDFRRPVISFSEKEMEEMNLRYYSPKIHSASFVLPRFVEKLLVEKSKERSSWDNGQRLNVHRFY